MSTCKKCKNTEKSNDYFYDDQTFDLCQKCGAAYINPAHIHHEQNEGFKSWLNKARSLVSKKS